MPEITDYLKLLEKRKRDEAEAETQRLKSIIPRIRDIAERASTIVGHPGWQWYLDSIQTRVKEVEKLREGHVNRMIFGKELGQDLERLKIELNTMDAEIKALKYAQDIVPQAIEQGQRVTSGVNSQAAAGSVDR